MFILLFYCQLEFNVRSRKDKTRQCWFILIGKFLQEDKKNPLAGFDIRKN